MCRVFIKDVQLLFESLIVLLSVSRSEHALFKTSSSSGDSPQRSPEQPASPLCTATMTRPCHEVYATLCSHSINKTSSALRMEVRFTEACRSECSVEMNGRDAGVWR